MKLLLRADGSLEMGTGHLYRSLALAQAWQARGGIVALAAASLPAMMRQRLEHEGLSCFELGVLPGGTEDHWATLDCIQRWGAQRLVLDGYHLGKLGPFEIPTLGIDDDGRAAYNDVNLCLDQNFGAQKTFYSGMDARLLLGPEFALLRRDYWAARPPRGLGEQLLLTFGGSDPQHWTERVMTALAPRYSGLAILGPAASPIQAPPHWVLRQNIVEMSKVLLAADIAVSAAGTTIWELFWAGLPSVLLAWADNQQQTAARIKEVGLAQVLLADELTLDRVIENTENLVKNTALRKQLSERVQRVVDGQGAHRVAAALWEAL